MLKTQRKIVNEKKTPSRITFGPDEIKKFEKHESSDEPETQCSMKPQFSNDRSPLASIDPIIKNIPSQAQHPEIYSVNDTAPKRTQESVPKSPSQKSPILFNPEIFTNEEAAPQPETYKKVVKTDASPSSSEPTQEK